MNAPLNLAPHGAVARLAMSLFPAGCRHARFMLLTAYFDESGTHGETSPVVTMAGFIGGVPQWNALEQDLADLLHEYGVTTFHAKKLRGRKGDFKDWSKSRSARFNSRFLRLADDHLSCGLAT